MASKVNRMFTVNYLRVKKGKKPLTKKQMKDLGII